MHAGGLQIIYDGQCPFCSSYVRLVRLRQAVGRVDLIDARSADPRVAAVAALGHDLDAGMVVRHGGTVYHGAAAVNILAVLSAPGGLANGVLRRLFAAPRVAAALYPALALGRGVTLRLLGRGRIADGAQKPGTGGINGGRGR